jgi:hypothetical protein
MPSRIAALAAGLTGGLVVGGLVIALTARDEPLEPVRTTTIGRAERSARDLPPRASLWATRREVLSRGIGSDLYPPRFSQNDAGVRVLSDQRETRGSYVDRLLTSAGPRVVRGLLVDRPVVYGRDRIAMLVTRVVRHRRGRERSQLVVLLGRTDGRVQRELVIATAGEMRPHFLGVSPRGDIAVMWAQCTTADACLDAERLRVAVRRAGRGTFGRPFELDRGPESDERSDTTMAFNTRGELVVAYVGTRGRVQARVQRPGGAFGPARSLGEQDGALDLDAAMTARGRILVAWSTQDGGFEIGHPPRVQAVFGSASSGRFGPDVHLLDPGPRPGDFNPEQIPEASVTATLAPDGSATLAWNQTNGVSIATSNHDGHLRPSTRLTSDRGGYPGVQTADDGRTLMVWHTRGQIFARLRAPGATAFGPIERVARTKDASGLDLRFDANTHRPVVSWIRAEGHNRFAFLSATRP